MSGETVTVTLPLSVAVVFAAEAERREKLSRGRARQFKAARRGPHLVGEFNRAADDWGRARKALNDRIRP